MGWILISLVSIGLIASVFAAVHHAEVVAHRVGEPFGTLVLALCVTVIEVALIVSMMLSQAGALGRALTAYWRGRFPVKRATTTWGFVPSARRTVTVAGPPGDGPVTSTA